MLTQDQKKDADRLARYIDREQLVSVMSDTKWQRLFDALKPIQGLLDFRRKDVRGSSVNMITALLILILERTNMIGIMKALGADNVSIRRIFIYYSAVIIGIGLVAGNVFGIGLCLLQQHFHFITLPQESYYLTYAPVDISWNWIASLNMGTIIFTLLLLVIPSMLVSKISPVKAIRFE